MDATERHQAYPNDDADAVADRLQLADWRRSVAEMYGEVRRLAVADPTGAWQHWRLTRERLYRDHPSSPVPPERRASFAAGAFAYDPNLRFELAVLPVETNRTGDRAAGSGTGFDQPFGASPVAGPLAGLALPISVGQPISFDRVGWLDVPFESGLRRLALFWLPEYSGGLFLPFRDATNGAETYGGGRYVLDGAKGADLGGDPSRGTIVVDFNFAYQPSCAFDPRWSCPLSPPENRLDLHVRAGERLR
jgi:hypothetical protein